MNHFIQGLAGFTTEFKEFLELGALNKQVQKIFSTPHFVTLEIRLTGQTVFVNLGRGNGFEGMFLSQNRPPSDWRVKDAYLEYLRKHLRSMRIENLETEEEKRILRIYFKSGPSRQASVMGFYWNGREFIFYHLIERPSRVEGFSNKQKKISYDGLKLREGVLEFERSFEQGPQSSPRKEKPFSEYEKSLEKFIVDQTNPKTEKKLKKKANKKVMRIHGDLKRIDLMSNVLLPFTDESKREELESIKILRFEKKKLLFGNKNYYEKRDLIFKKIKELRSSKEIQLSRLDSLKIEMSKPRAQKEKIRLPKIINIFSLKNTSSKAKDSDNDIPGKYSVFKFKNLKVFVGHDSLGNDAIRKHFGKKQDLWLHLEGYKGAHGIVKGEIDDLVGVMEMIGSILRDLSKLSILEVPLVYTELKNIRGVSGRKGAVTIKGAKYLTVSYNENWRHNIETLKGSNI